MWLFTKHGFYSVVQETKLKRHVGQMSVRAREPGALELLRDNYMPTLTATSVTPKSVTADYRYRAWIGRDELAEGMAAAARDIDYDNFKSEVAKVRGPGKFEMLLHEVWSVMGRLQPGGPYGYGGRGYPPVPEGEPPLPSAKKKKGLPSSFGSASASGTCADCGHELGEGEGIVLGGELVCFSLQECQARQRVGR